MSTHRRGHVSDTSHQFIDRRGSTHIEKSPLPHHRDAVLERVVSPAERAWDDEPDRREEIARNLDKGQSLTFSPRPGEDSTVLWQFVYRNAEATQVLLWTNPVLDHQHLDRHSMRRLDGTDLWILGAALPATLRCSYGFAVHTGDGPAPWQNTEGRRETTLAVMSKLRPDPGCPQSIPGPKNTGRVSVAAGPSAPVPGEVGACVAAAAQPKVTAVPVSSSVRETVWIYSPPQHVPSEALLILFDGHVWVKELPPVIDEAIRSGALPGLHVVFISAEDPEQRWARLGIPGGVVDDLLDEILPTVRSLYPVPASGEATVVAGQSFGGLAALWAVALSNGDIRHAIAQSPSLWRFDLAPALTTDPQWETILLQAGTHEGDMITTARALHDHLRGAVPERHVVLRGVSGGHDWALWRHYLLDDVAALVTGMREVTPPSRPVSDSGALQE